MHCTLDGIVPLDRWWYLVGSSPGDQTYGLSQIHITAGGIGMCVTWKLCFLKEQYPTVESVRCIRDMESEEHLLSFSLENSGRYMKRFCKILSAYFQLLQSVLHLNN